MSRLARIASPVALVAALAVPALALPASSGASTSRTTTPKILTCTNTTVSRPSNFVISCADAGAALTKTHWSTWNAMGATGTTTFALNLCTPYCAASPISHFVGSTVRLSAPVTTKRGRLFSKLVVRYIEHGKAHTFSFSWTGEPRF